MIKELQKKTAQGIVNIFETSQLHGDYGKVTLLPNDSGHLTYGRSQTTLGSGNLYLLIVKYCETAGAQFANSLRPFLERLRERDTSLDHDMTLRRLLQEAGDDMVMQEVQDAFFDRIYWKPSEQTAQRNGISTALGVAIIYDSHVHGSWGRIRDKTTHTIGPVSQTGENHWINNYVKIRRNWLANHSNTLLHRTVYRMDTFDDLMEKRKWELELPITVRGVLVNEETLLTTEHVRASADEEKILKLQIPYLVGEEVRVVQEALKKTGYNIRIDGIYGPMTEATVRLFQEREGLTIDGVVGPATRGALDL